ncbi:hypothetical protein [Trichococcus pasteurii]|uniref:hypothetical protein n=1 Tax=Trichococcus pasteurii TaxID=43064 RepID=UPI000B34E6CB|nr:hypothetical protein [Trichococcus pasteurii]
MVDMVQSISVYPLNKVASTSSALISVMPSGSLNNALPDTSHDKYLIQGFFITMMLYESR